MTGEGASRRDQRPPVLALGGCPAEELKLPRSAGAATVDDAGREPTLLERLQAEAERSLAEPDLAPADVADRAGVSVRYLHKLFAASGTSFGRWLVARRLERARAALLAPVAGDRTIATVALEHGFRDPSHFARVFRARYGATPAQVRAGAAARLPVVR